MKSVKFALPKPSVKLLLSAALLLLAQRGFADASACWLFHTNCPDPHAPPAQPPNCPDGAGAGGGIPQGPSCPSCAVPKGMEQGLPVWTIAEPYITLNLEDEPAGYTPARSSALRVGLHLYYRQRGAAADDGSTIFSVGTNWSCSLRSYLVLGDQSTGWYVLHRGGSGYVDYTNGVPNFLDGSILNSTDGGTTWQLEYRNGAKDIFGKTFTAGDNATRYFLTAQNDPAGNSLIYNYESTNASIVQLTSVTDPDGRTNTLSYNDAAYPLQITGFTDAFNRSATITYDDSNHGVITNIIDAIGMTNSFTYASPLSPLWITSMTTPYGTTSFAYGGFDAASDYFFTTSGAINRSVDVTLPNAGHHLFVYRQDCSAFLSASNWALPSTSPLANTLDAVDQQNRNSFHWSPLQYDHLSTNYLLTLNATNLTTADYTLGALRHWLLDPGSGSLHSPASLSLERVPSPDGTTQGRVVFYDYDGKTAGNNYIGTNSLPSFVALVLPDGDSRFTRYYRGGHSQITQTIETYTQTNAATGLRTNTFTYAANNVDMIQQIGPVGEQVVSNYFNANHQVLASSDALNQTTVFSYSASHLLVGVSRPTGLTTTNFYDNFSQLVTNADLEIGRTNVYSWANGLIFSHSDKRNLVTTNAWDLLQRLVGVTYPDGTTTSNIYTVLDLTDTKDRLGYWTHRRFNKIRQMTVETNANLTVTGYSYCDCGALLYQTNAWNAPVQQVISFLYDLQGNRTNTTYPDNYSVTNWFNYLQQVTQTADGAAVRTLSYNNQGLLTNSSDTIGPEQQTVFSIEDMPIYVTDRNGVSLTNSFDLLGRLRTRTYPDGGVEAFGYSARGLIAFTNQIFNTNFFAYDPGLRKTFETNANDELLKYTYNAAGDLLTLTDGKGQGTAWHTDQYGRVTNKVDNANAVILKYIYDPNGRLTNRFSLEKGNTVYSWDPLANLTNIAYLASGQVRLAYDPLNRLTNMVDNAGTTIYSYTAGNQLLTEDGPFVSDTVTNSYVNRLRTALVLQQPTGAWTNGFTWDDAKRLSSVTSPAGTFSYAYTNVGPGILPALLVRQLNLANGLAISNRFDSVARLLETSLRSDKDIDHYVYQYDPASQRTNVIRRDSSSYALQYDRIGQLKVATGSVASESRGFSYDTAWNLNWRTNNASPSQFVVTNNNELVSANGFSLSYDANGNQTNYSSQNYTYDDENRLTLVSDDTYLSFRTGFVYDGLSRLRQRVEYIWVPAQGPLLNEGWNVSNIVDYIYDGNRVIQERNHTNNLPDLSYTRGSDLSGSLEGAGGIGGLLARSTNYSSGNWLTHHYYFADGNGNVVYISDSGKGLAATYRYDPFGNTISNSGPLAAANVYRFSSKEIHVNTGMYYYLYRFYDPNLQRWISRDPAAERGGLNLYQFVRNNPPDQTDPLGLECDPKGCFDFTATITDVSVTVVSSDGKCSDDKIIGRVKDYLKGKGNGKPQKQKCKGDCSCVTDQTLSGSGGTVKWTLKDIDVGIVGKCIVTVDVAITYKDGSGTIGHCEEKKPKPTCFLDIP